MRPCKPTEPTHPDPHDSVIFWFCSVIFPKRHPFSGFTQFICYSVNHFAIANSIILLQWTQSFCYSAQPFLGFASHFATVDSAFFATMHSHFVILLAILLQCSTILVNSVIPRAIMLCHFSLSYNAQPFSTATVPGHSSCYSTQIFLVATVLSHFFSAKKCSVSPHATMLSHFSFGTMLNHSSLLQRAWPLSHFCKMTAECTGAQSFCKMTERRRGRAGRLTSRLGRRSGRRWLAPRSRARGCVGAGGRLAWAVVGPLGPGSSVALVDLKGPTRSTNND
jgi:hypothetical protein